MGIKTVPHRPYSPDVGPCNFSLFPKLKEKLRGCRYETIEDMKEAVTKVIDMVTRVQILDEADLISHGANTLGKSMNPIILPPAMGK